MKPDPLQRRTPSAAASWPRGLVLWLAALLLAGAIGSAQARPLAPAPERRVALVIGNASYARMPLRNPVNDARAVAQALRGLGFDVEYRENAELAAMLDAMREFVVRARDSQVRLFYFAGHGAQYRGRNYLIPVEAALAREDDLPLKTANVSDLVDRLGQFGAGVNLVILDACRDKPFPVGTVTRGLGSARSLSPGLAQLTAPRGTLVAYSTAPGAVAFDGSDANSTYTKHLLSHLPVPGLPVEQLFKRVRIAVAEETRLAQVPWETSSLMGDFCFRASASGDCIATDAPVNALSSPR